MRKWVKKNKKEPVNIELLLEQSHKREGGLFR